jgi:hypothetical protein
MIFITENTKFNENHSSFGKTNLKIYTAICLNMNTNVYRRDLRFSRQ